MKQQHTLAKEIKIEGIGLHSGCNSTLILHPAEAGNGIIFRRSDIASQPQIKALYSNVVDTRNCTCLGDKEGNIVSTIEHLMAALNVCGIDNALIEVNNTEIPIMDGSGKCFYEALKTAELVEQNAPRRCLKVLKPVKFTDDKGNETSLEPAEDLEICMEIDFPSKIVGHQIFDSKITPAVYEKEIAPSRTFCEKYQIDYLRSLGLIKGGSLDNAVVLDGETIMNPEGFRVKDECVKHKALDAVGDLYTSGYRIKGKFTGKKSGHFHNNELLKKLFADSTNYTLE